MDYEQDLKINEMALDKEWLQQSSLYFKYAKLQAEADAVLRRTKESLEITKASLFTRIRIEKEQAKDKCTEAILDASIKNTTEYIDALIKVQRAQTEFQILQVAVRAFEQRKYALENLVKLQLSGYYADPKAPNKEYEMEKLGERQTEALTERLGK